MSVCPAVVVDGGAAEAAAGRRVLRFGGFGSDSDPAVSAAADGNAGSNAQRDQRGRGANTAAQVVMAFIGFCNHINIYNVIKERRVYAARVLIFNLKT